MESDTVQADRPDIGSTKVRIVCISDTHNAAPGEGYNLPKGDILIHAGDLTNQGSYSELKKAVTWLEKADFPVKVVIAGTAHTRIALHFRSLKARKAIMTCPWIQITA